MGCLPAMPDRRDHLGLVSAPKAYRIADLSLTQGEMRSSLSNQLYYIASVSQVVMADLDAVIVSQGTLPLSSGSGCINVAYAILLCPSLRGSV